MSLNRNVGRAGTYLYQIDHLVYGPPMRLTVAMRAVYGCGNARVLREDGSVAVDRAGSSYAIMHPASGRELLRRSTRR